jgi:protein-histidine pros-kinase
MTKVYGKNNGFGWKLNDLIGAQIVSVPARLVNESADAALRRVLTWLAAGYAVIFVVVNLGVYSLARRGGNT